MTDRLLVSSKFKVNWWIIRIIRIAYVATDKANQMSHKIMYDKGYNTIMILLWLYNIFDSIYIIIWSNS